MTQILEPSPVLVDYYHKAKEFEIKEMLLNKIEGGEWLYIQSNLDQNIFLLKKLDELCLIPQSTKVCDCGIGLGTALFDIYLQSKEIEVDFSFTGIEKQNKYINYLTENLLDFWQEDLEVITGDLMNQQYEDFDIIYCYTPFKCQDKLKKFYLKIISEMKVGALLIENRNSGLGSDNILLQLSENLEPIDLETLIVFRKK